MTEILFERDSYSEENTEALGRQLAQQLLPGDFVAMYGDLGAGKTAFVRGMASLLTPNAKVCSPTYNIVNEYRGSGTILRHFDLYRIQSEEDLYSIGFYDYLGEGIIAAEWCENIPYAMPDAYITVDIRKTGDGMRHIIAARRNGGESALRFNGRMEETGTDIIGGTEERSRHQ